MKQWIWMCCLALLATQPGRAQKKPSSTRINKATLSVTKPKQPDDKLISLTSTGSYPALAFGSGSSLQISDPVIFRLNRQAAGVVPEGDPPILGMPKHYYGFAGGKLLLKNSTAPGIGGTTGSGSVGTGTSAGTTGTGSNVVGVNGKSRMAGPGLYGSPPFGFYLDREKKRKQ